MKNVIQMTEKLINVECFDCGADTPRVILPESRSGRVVRCMRCGAIYVSPRKAGQFLTDARMGDPPPEVPPDEKKWAKINAAHRFNLLHRWNFVHDPGTLLDVGCWTGFFLKTAEKRGWKVKGLEPVDAAAQWGRINLGLDILTAVFEKAELPNGNFDMVSLMHALEHLSDPNTALARVNRLLKPGGIIALETPNADCLAARILGRRWRQFISRHVAFFTPVTIARLLKRHGFENVRVRRIGRTVPVRLIADRIKRYYSRPLGNVLDRVFRITGLSNAGIRIDPGDIMFAAARKK